jgi:putative Holliday junction resolvase
MALDYGRRRIGIAISDPTRTIATPGGVIERPRTAKPKNVPRRLLEMVRESDPSTILVGIPFSMDGLAGPMAEEVRIFAEAVKNATGISIVEWDERLTTAQAEREIQTMGLSRGKRREKGRTDEMAAMLMLSAYLRLKDLQQASKEAADEDVALMDTP